jgi:benzoate-CoA ligase family protein
VIEIPDRFNMAHYFLDARIEEGRGARRAIVSGERTWSYEEVQRESNRVAALLVRLGVEWENRVLLVLPDLPEFVFAWFGILKAGAVFTMQNTILPTEDYEYYLEYTRAKVAFVHTSALERFEPAAKKARFLRHVVVVGDDRGPYLSFADETARESGTFTNADTSKDDVAGWLFTSGSTGRAKGAVHCHHDFPWNTERYAKRTLGYREDDVTLSVPRLFFGYATGTNVMFPFAVGACTVLDPARPTPERIVELCEKYRPTILTNVPTMINQILQLPDAAKRDLSSLRFTLSAGEALPAELYRKWMETYRVEILDGIGSAEMFHIYITNRLGDVKMGSLGRIVEGYEARIVDGEGREVPDGEIGRLRVKGDSAALGYFGAHEKSKETFAGDWCTSADLFRRDADGYYYFAGRADDMLKVGGIFVSPLEIEDCLLRHPSVREVAVVGVEEHGLTVPKAFVVAKEGFAAGEALATELQAFVKRTLAPYKYPRQVAFLEALPRGGTGKVLRRELR